MIEFIKAEMRKRRMTQQELARLAGLSEPCIFRFLSREVKAKVRDRGARTALSRLRTANEEEKIASSASRMSESLRTKVQTPKRAAPKESNLVGRWLYPWSTRTTVLLLSLLMVSR